MTSSPLTLDHQDRLYERLRAVDVNVSEYSFANLYLFRRAHNYQVVDDDGEVFIHGESYDGEPFLMPTRDLRELDVDTLHEHLAEGEHLFPIPEEWFEGLDDSTFSHTYRDGDTDYLYRTEKIANFEGRKLHKKRNLLRQFERRYDCDDQPLTDDRLPDARDILDRWQEDMSAPPEETDYHPCREALDLYEELHLCGAIHYVDGEPAGFVVGEELNERTFALHFAKALRKFKGVFEHVFNTFAEVLPERYELMNFEQDLGIAALRQAKSSYDPDLLLKKYRVSLEAP